MCEVCMSCVRWVCEGVCVRCVCVCEVCMCEVCLCKFVVVCNSA